MLLVQCAGSGQVGDANVAGAAGGNDMALGGSPAGAGGAGVSGSGIAGSSESAGSSGRAESGGGGSSGSAGGASEANDTGGSGGVVGGTGGATAGGGMASQCSGGKGVPASATATLVASGFESGKLAPYSVCTTEGPNSVQAAALNGEPSAKLYWQQAGYDGTRLKRGAEACSALAFYKDGWYGLEFYLPSPGFPSDKTLGIAQIFSLGGCSSWAAMLQIHGNELWIEHRGNCASPAEFQVRLAADIPRNTWLPVVMHFVASHAGAGSIEVWYRDAVCTPNSPTYRKTGINFGFGDWTADALTQTASNQIALKFGMYNFDDGNYTPGETRTLYYDNVSQLIGNPANAFATVNPLR
jgi:Polysaccharide lyase